eukprot:TRINITY_DN1463_c0_g1_i8.p1 TRINITY_DN1463_c0_g1~~TRINITY_DN1463_c0_g1_i8.p1  ORF type:complete len:390 (+),score=97.57 TRINITY_DN1463_c0_g1_i8:180-1349(+)
MFPTISPTNKVPDTSTSSPNTQTNTQSSATVVPSETTDTTTQVSHEYNPFEALNNPGKVDYSATIPGGVEANPKNSKKTAKASTGSTIFASDPTSRAEDLKRKEAELLRKERELKEREISMAHGGSGQSDMAIRQREEALARKEQELLERERLISHAEGLVKPKNWPICCPFMYHNIAEEIPTNEKRSIVRKLYWTWIFTFVTNCVNFLAVMIAFFSGLMEKVEITPGQPISDFLFATLFLVLGVPLSFLGWYYQSYKVMQNNRVTKKYYWVFFLMILNIGFCISQACGLYSGAAGAGYMGRYLACGQAQCQTYIPTGPEQSTFQVIGSFYVFSFCFWVVSALIAMFCLLLLYKFYKSSGGEDLQREDIENEASRIVATQAVKQAARNI